MHSVAFSHHYKIGASEKKESVQADDAYTLICF